MLSRVCYLFNFLTAVSVGLVFVFLADVQDRYGLADWELGFIASSGFVAALVTQLVMSPFADRGLIKPLVIFSVVTATAGTFLFAIGTSSWVLASSRGLVGVGGGLFTVLARKALLGMDTVNGGSKVGKLMSTGVGGFIAGPAIGALLGTISFEAPFVVIGIATIVVGIPAIKLVGSAPIATSQAQHGDIGRLIRRPRIQIALLVTFVVFGFVGIFDAVVDRYLTDLGASDAGTALVLIAIGAPLLVLPSKAGALAERIGGVRVAVPAVVVAIPSMFAFGMANSVLLLACFGVVQGVIESFEAMGSQMLILEVTGAERAAVGGAAIDAVGLTTGAISASLAPVIYGEFGPRWLFGGWSGCAVVALVLIAWRATAISEPPATVPVAVSNS